MADETFPAVMRKDLQFDAPQDQTLHVSAFLLAKRGGKLALVKAKDYKGDPAWMLPAVLLRYGESPADAAARVAKQRLGVARAKPKLRAVESFDGAHDGSGGHWDLAFVYEVAGPAKLKAGPEAEEAQYVTARDAPWSDLGNAHADVLATVWKRPKAKAAKRR